MTDRNIGAWISVIAISYFAHTLYWFTRSARFNFYSLTTNLSFFGPILSSLLGRLTIIITIAVFLLFGIGGLTVRLIGAINAVSASYQVWRKGTDSLALVKGRISNALFCEGLYWALFVLIILPFGLYATNVRTEYITIDYLTVQFLVASFSLQIILIAPFLIALSLRFRRHDFDLKTIVKSKLLWIACINYVIALYANYNLRWLEVIVYRGVEGLFIENTYIGLANSAITLFLAVVFAVAAALPVLNNRESPNLKWLSLALIFMGLHFLIHILYTAYTGFLTNSLEYRLKFMLLSDVWPVTALGLGLYLFRRKNSVEQRSSSYQLVELG